MIFLHNTGQSCRNPSGIKARTAEKKVPYVLTKEIVSLTLEEGLKCENNKQNDRLCENYEIQLCCLKSRPHYIGILT